ncbi:hypothetical protein DFJ74DRAFT_672499 [Hyaloraphidium curvatum]|nr:hypothetical protein DFJ74DRAFT_672499 [Hyaloraphidium curvatum]
MTDAPPPAEPFAAEVSTAVNYLAGYLLADVPHTQLARFRAALLAAVTAKCRVSWDPERPEKGSAFRSVAFHGRVDPLVERAAADAGISRPIGSFFPSELVLWCDPGEVSFRIGEHGTVQSLYRDPSTPTSAGSGNGSAGSGSISPAEPSLPPLPRYATGQKRQQSFRADDDEPLWVLPTATPRNKIRIRRPDEAQSSPAYARAGSGLAFV